MFIDSLALTVPRALLLPILFILGSCIGSLLNVCIHRMPREESIVRPRSRCPQCKHPVVWYDNIPLLSYVLLGARCRHCHKVISWRYPLVELLAGLSALAVFLWFGAGVKGFVYFVFVCSLIVVSFIDLDFQIIPDEISLGGLVLGVVLSVVFPVLHGTDAHLTALGRSVVGLLVGGALLYGTGLVGDFIFRKESMGGGDVKLLAMAGSILGWKPVLVTFFIAPIFALIPGLFILLLKRSHIIPYGPFLSIGLVTSLFFGNQILYVTGIEDTVGILWKYYGW